MGAAVQDRTTYRQVFAVREFRALFGGQAVSLLGDALAQVALAILVFQRTHSALLTAVTYALLYLPPIVGGPLLSALADLLPRRGVIIGSDLVRIALVATMAIPAMPVWSLDVLLIAVSLAQTPCDASRSGLGPVVLPGDKWPLATAIITVTAQVIQVAGFLAGALVVVAVGARQALLLDAATFAVSAIMVALWVQSRPAASRREPGTWISPAAMWAQTVAGARTVLGDRTLRLLMLFGLLAAAGVVPEALAAPYAHALGRGNAAVGLLLAAPAAGIAIGGACVVRLVAPSRRATLLGWLAVMSFLPLAAVAARPPLAVVVLLWFASGVFASYQVIAIGLFGPLLPNASRGTAFGFASSGVLAAQGLGLIAGGAVAQAIGPPMAVAVAGAAGLGAAGLLARAWARRPA